MVVRPGPHELIFAFWFGVFDDLYYADNWNTSIVGENVGLCGYRHTTIQWLLLTMTYPPKNTLYELKSRSPPCITEMSEMLMGEN